jgi:hypothetical protein
MSNRDHCVDCPEGQIHTTQSDHPFRAETQVLKNMYRFSVTIKAFGRISVQTVEAKSEAEALRIVQEEIGYSWEIKPMAYARYDS